MAHAKQLIGAARIALLLVLGSVTSFGQVLSKPASVMLVARVESLSMSVQSLPEAIAAGLDREPVGPRTVAVTASWAVPADRTTVRLVGDLRGGTIDSANRMDVWLAGVSGDKAEKAIAQLIRTGVSESSPGDITLRPQGSESTAHAKTDRSELNVGQAALSHQEVPEVLHLRVEAF